MRKLGIILLITVLSLVACQSNDETESGEESDDKLFVITSFTLIEDMVKQIGGDHIETYNMVPTGTDPHEYDPLPEDIKAASDADFIIYNGFNLEGGDNGWLAKLADSSNIEDDIMYELMAGADPLYLSDDSGNEAEINPHTFLDPVLGIHMAENVIGALSEVDPDNEEFYQSNGDEYVAELEDIANEYEEKISEIP